MSAPLTLAVILAVAIPVELFLAYRPAADLADRWAAAHGLGLTPENRPMVARYLRSARVLRTWGAVAGAILPSLIEFAVNGRVVVLGFGTDGTSAPLGFGTIFVGYLVGALCAEIAHGRPVVAERRTARLDRRELDDYLSRRVVAAQRVFAVAAALGVIAIALVPFDDSISNPGPVGLALGAALVLAFGAVLEAIERWLVRRPQPFTRPPLVEADDAIRAQSVHSVAGAGLSLLLLACCGVSLGLQASELDVLNWAMVAPAAAFFVGSLFACGEIGQGSWRVRRRVRAAVSA